MSRTSLEAIHRLMAMSHNFGQRREGGSQIFTLYAPRGERNIHESEPSPRASTGRSKSSITTDSNRVFPSCSNCFLFGPSCHRGGDRTTARIARRCRGARRKRKYRRTMRSISSVTRKGIQRMAVWFQVLPLAAERAISLVLEWFIFTGSTMAATLRREKSKRQEVDGFMQKIRGRRIPNEAMEMSRPEEGRSR